MTGYLVICLYSLEFLKSFSKQFSCGSLLVSSFEECFSMGHHLFPEFTVAGVCSEISVYFADSNAFMCPSRVVRGGVHVCSQVYLFDMSFKIEESCAVKSGSFKDGSSRKVTSVVDCTHVTFNTHMK